MKWFGWAVIVLGVGFGAGVASAAEQVEIPRVSRMPEKRSVTSSPLSGR